MVFRPQGFAQRLTALVCSVVLAFAGVASPGMALGEESGEVAQLQAQADSMVATIEATTAAYRQAEAEVQSLEEQIASNEARAAELEQKLPVQQARAAACVKELYLLQQSTSNLLDLVFSAKNFNQFIATIRYIDTIYEHNNREVEQLVRMTSELEETNRELVLQRDAAKQKEDEALLALDEAREVRRQLQERAEAIAAAEAEERAKAIAAAQAAIDASNAQAEQERESSEGGESSESGKDGDANNEGQEAGEQKSEQKEESKKEREQEEATFTTSSGYTAPVEVPEEDPSASTDPLTTNTTDEETSGWAARINAYLAGSPLAGYGQTFATAAATYGVDPRLSPAISCVESGKGAICFLPHNAWGWGRSSWSDWESAIYDHVAGLASGYGGTLTLEGAMRYCPPTYQEWYSSVLAEMNSI